jgi:hypothetical protein
MINVKNKRCEHGGCDTRPLFGVPGKRPTRCAKHKYDGMINVKSKKCENDGCDSRPSYSNSGLQQLIRACNR